jgi:hypothetical protein
MSFGAVSGFATSGGRRALVSGLASTNYLQGIVPLATITVFLTGTSTQPTIYADASGTALTNPFTADNLNSVAPGKFIFFADPTYAYDVVLSGGVAPNNFAAPVTLVGLFPFGSSSPPPSFSITTFTGGGMFELGFSLVSPAFTATYSGTPTSANITNTDGTSSPTNLTAPYTSGTIPGTFVHSVAATVTWTLHATNGTSSGTMNATGSWAERIFGGIGSAGGATGATASGTTAVLVGDTGTLTSVQLGPEVVGQAIGPLTPPGGGAYIYVLLAGGAHTFTDNSTGFTFPVNAPTAVTFVNVNGVSLSMFLYQSTYMASLPVTLKVQT